MQLSVSGATDEKKTPLAILLYVKRKITISSLLDMVFTISSLLDMVFTIYMYLSPYILYYMQMYYITVILCIN